MTATGQGIGGSQGRDQIEEADQARGDGDLGLDGGRVAVLGDFKLRVRNYLSGMARGWENGGGGVFGVRNPS